MMLGSVALWWGNCGVRNLLLPAWLGAFACMVTMILEQHELALFLCVCTVLSAYCAVAWQSIKLQASELQHLIPGFKQHILKQSMLVLFSLYLPLFTIAFFYQDRALLLSLALAGTLGQLFWWYCRKNSAVFRYVTALFFIVAILAAWVHRLPETWLLPVWLIHTALFVGIIRDKYGDSWAKQALFSYQRGLNSGWSPIHAVTNGHWTQQLNEKLFPASFFFGSSLAQYLKLYAIAALLVVVINIFVDISDSARFIAANFVLLIFYLLHWTRVQRHRSWEQLYLLPLYASRDAMQNDFVRVTERLCLILLPVGFLFSYLLYLPHQQPPVLEAVFYALCVSASCLLCNAIANFCRKSHWLGMIYVLALLALVSAMYWTVPVPVYWRLGGVSGLFALSILLHRASARRLFTSR